MDAVGKLSGDSCRGRSSLIDRITGFEPPKKVYICALMLFLAFFGIVSYFHEPWLDEAEAWMIARDASYYDMFFVLPHYEGHPPLWWLILSVPAKLGMPYELSLSMVMIIISGIIAYLIMFKSPFCGIVRLILPFTYYFFYQYGIIARPYGLLTLAMILAAIFYRQRNQKPFRYVLSLALLCAASAFGIIISGGLALVWCGEIVMEYGFKRLFTDFLRSRRFASLLFLLIFALLLIVTVSSYDNAFVGMRVTVTPLIVLQGIWYMLFMLPADAMAFGSGYGLGIQLQLNRFSAECILTMSIVGLFILAIIIDNAVKYRKKAVFAVPYLLMAVFGGSVYFFQHHEGIIMLFFIFIFWICLDDAKNTPDFKTSASFLDKISEKSSMISSRSCTAAGAAAVIFISIFWCIHAVVIDIGRNYSYGREAAAFISENGLDSLNIMSSFSYDENNDGDSWISADVQDHAVTINPYFDENIFFNLNSGDKDMGYILHRMSDEANEEQFALWRSTAPDIIIGEPHLEIAYEGTDVKKSSYFVIKTIEYNQIWKLNHASNFVCIYMRKDLFDDYPDIQPENPADYEFIYQ